LRTALGVIALGIGLWAGAPTAGPRITPGEQAALDHISASSLRGALSFLASDALEGRDTPSRGLDIAAEYIASKFRAAGLDPFFQTAQVIRATAVPQQLAITDGGRTVTAGPGEMRARAERTVELADAQLYKVDLAAPLPHDAGVFDGKVVLFEFGPGQWSAVERLWPVLMSSGAAAVVVVGERGRALIESDMFVPGAERPVPVVSVVDDSVKEFCRAMKTGSAARISLRILTSSRTVATAKNVIAILRGADPELRGTCVVLSAHYDHLGVKRTTRGELVFNGANDDGSGTVSVLEVAAALASMPQPPRRSIVFVTFFGEEEGLYGSAYFARHLPCPLAQTIADINLEQLGRPNTDHGEMRNSLTFVGQGYTTLAAGFASAAEATGVTIAAHPALGDEFFSRSDNFSLAERGIPAQTIAIPANFAEYHAVGDTWEKIDYANLARLDGMIALGLIRLADDSQPPQWNAGNPAVGEYREEWRRMHGSAPAGRP